MVARTSLNFAILSYFPYKCISNPFLTKTDSGQQKYFFVFGPEGVIRNKYADIVIDLGYDACILNEEGEVVKKTKNFDMEKFYATFTKSNRRLPIKELLQAKKSEMLEGQRQLQEKGKE